MKQEANPPIYSFTCNTLKDQPQRFFSAVLIVLAAGLLFSLSFGFAYAIIALVLMVISLPELFFPFKYKLYKDRVMVDRFFYKVTHEYSYYKKVVDDKNGIFLSPYRIKTRMENFRGILIRLPEDKKAEVVAFIKEKVETAETRINF